MTGTATSPGAGATPPASPRSGTPDRGPFDLPRLPRDLRDEVTHRLPPREASILPLLGKQAKTDYADPARGADLYREAQTADLQTAHRLLNDPAGIAALPGLFQAAPRTAVANRLGELAMQVEDLPPTQRATQFDEIRQLAGQLPGPERGVPLTRLAVALAHLQKPDRHARFATLLEHGKELPRAVQLDLLMNLAERVPALAAAFRDTEARRLQETARDWLSFSRAGTSARA